LTLTFKFPANFAQTAAAGNQIAFLWPLNEGFLQLAVSIVAHQFADDSGEKRCLDDDHAIHNTPSA
jgi:hypothetical protein